MKYAYYYQTKIGKLGIVENNGAITHINLEGKIPKDVEIVETELHSKASKQILEYLDGKRNNFDININPDGTEFQKKVWSALQQIPYGQTVSYKYIAEKIGNIKASRAVGMANNKNPILIVVPCHRVIGANGKLVGYAAGIENKKLLLDIERIIV